jgi:sigma-B regulation protein RsbU (phosphoserine phosphatase)
VQLELFPKKLPNLSSRELAGVCMPSRFVSGDYYDCLSLGNNWTAIVLGDVSGKGIGAALGWPLCRPRFTHSSGSGAVRG